QAAGQVQRQQLLVGVAGVASSFFYGPLQYRRARLPSLPSRLGGRGEREGGSPGPERTGKQRRRTTCSRRKDVAHAGSGSGSSSTRRPTATMCVSATRSISPTWRTSGSIRSASALASAPI